MSIVCGKRKMHNKCKIIIIIP